ncbi:hypothetical protein TNCV_3329181 [Trichonephila clavipes]|nr:hypothetical protein TNCV_3329181 [Trichonephila clavipes]
MNDGTPAHFCTPVRSLGYGIHQPLDQKRGSSSMASMIARSLKVGFLPMRQSQGIGVSRRSVCTNGLRCSSACSLYCGGPCCCDVYTHLFHSTLKPTSIFTTEYFIIYNILKHLTNIKQHL